MVLAAVLLLTWLARRLRVASPIVLLLGGVPLAYVPWANGVPLPPSVILLIFLPALLYWESLTMSLREIRANLRMVLLMSIALVLATAGGVAAVGHALGLSWPVAWVLGTLAPFVAFLLAEKIHASGVLAVVVCGLALSHVGPRLASGRTRLQARAFWQLTAVLLNGARLLLLGMQIRGALHRLTHYSLGEVLRDGLLVSAAVIGTRMIWMNTAPYIIRALDRRPQQRPRRIEARHRFLLAWSGFRGGTSLA